MRAAAGLVILALVGCVETPVSPPPVSDAGPSCSIGPVVDGDTFVLDCRGKRTLARLTDVDAPEIAAARCPAERRKGAAARAYLLELVDQSPVSGVTYGERIEDSARQLVRVDLGGEDLAGLMVAGGHAKRMVGGERPDWCAGA